MVSGLGVANVSVAYSGSIAVDGVSFDVAPGQVLALLGPSGCGKSSLLRAIIGLEPLAAGRVLWDGDDVSHVKVHRRQFGLVFQDGQLFPTMTVAKNVAYGLSGLPRPARRQRAEELLELVGLAGYGPRRPTELSGGQAQRVALARALAPRPRMILLDEPLSALDTALRRRLSEELRRILTETHTTAVYVTHDQEEAFTVADRVAVMSAGKILQLAAPDEIWNRPASREVAAFLGFRTLTDAATAGALGWSGELAADELLGLGPRSLDLDPGGVPLPVLRQSMNVDHFVVTVALPDGQLATVAAPAHVAGETVRVRLTSGAITPA